MTEPLLPALPPPAGLTMVGSDDAAVCVDGVCAVPSPGGDRAALASPEGPDPTR